MLIPWSLLHGLPFSSLVGMWLGWAVELVCSFSQPLCSASLCVLCRQVVLLNPPNISVPPNIKKKRYAPGVSYNVVASAPADFVWKYFSKQVKTTLVISHAEIYTPRRLVRSGIVSGRSFLKSGDAQWSDRSIIDGRRVIDDFAYFSPKVR
jgi:hypothetical protein